MFHFRRLLFLALVEKYGETISTPLKNKIKLGRILLVAGNNWVNAYLEILFWFDANCRSYGFDPIFLKQGKLIPVSIFLFRPSDSYVYWWLPILYLKSNYFFGKFKIYIFKYVYGFYTERKTA